MTDRYSGDPKVIVTASGATFQWIGGQPVMDQGVENHGVMALLIDDDWCGNLLLDDDHQIGSDFEESVIGQAITLQGLDLIRNRAEIALTSPLFPDRAVSVVNPVSDQIQLVATLGPGTAPLELNRYGQNWQNQADNPAYKRVI